MRISFFTHIVAFLAGGGIVLFYVFSGGSTDKNLIKVKKSREILVKTIKETQKEDKKYIKKIIKEKKQGHRQIVEIDQSIKKAKQKIIKEETQGDRQTPLHLVELDQSIKLAKRSDLENLMKLSVIKINFLEHRIEFLEEANGELILKLERAHSVQKQAVASYNKSIKAQELLNAKLAARKKGMIIGLSVGLPLAFIGGVALGIYIIPRR